MAGSKSVGKNTATEYIDDDNPVDRWLRIKRVFLEALEASEDERADYLNEVCGTDQALRGEVESLLSCHVQAVEGGFLDDLPESSSPRAVLEAIAAAFDDTSPNTLKDDRTSERPTHAAPGITDIPAGDRFGDYELLETIGEGGMGVVYRARQIRLNREVALKMIRAGRFSTTGEIERFSREAEAAAGLAHPGIVPVFEIGVEEGRHYFTMALIDGLSLADHLKNAGGPLEPKSATELMCRVAEAVHYAHEHGVIHRDLKPANILLDEHDMPRVVDFGLAKQVETESGLTFTGQVLGTPSFMSPEQAAGETTLVGPSSDVYALGAVLYALLTGRPPFSAASVTETLRQVQHDEPVRPRHLNSALPRDLETICLKCLAKEPSKRYASAQEMADELTRYLAGRPILARPVGTIAVVARWCRRNPLATSFIGFLATFVPVVIALLLSMNVRLAQEARETEFERQLADHSFRAARNAVDEQFTFVSQETLLDRPGLQPLRRQLLLGSQKYYQEFLATRGDDPDLQAEAALINFRLGVITAALHTDSDQDAYAEANTYFATALRIYDGLPDQNDPQVLGGLGNVWTRIGQIHNKLQQDQPEIDAFRQALAFRRRLNELESNVENQRLLANAEMNLGQALWPVDPMEPSAHIGVAFDHLTTAQSIRAKLLQQEPGNAKVVRDQVKGYVLLADSVVSDRNGAVEKYLTAAIQTMEAQSLETPPTLEEIYLRAIVVRRLGGAIADTAASSDDLGRARDLFEEALNILNPLAAENPLVVDYMSALAATYYDTALVLQELESSEEARSHLRTALKLLDPLTKGRNPDDILRWAGAHAILAEMEPPNSDAAITHIREARTLLVEKIDALTGNANAENVREEYRAAVQELDQLLADRAKL
jgi:tRNA A-37 threonylcarbamoyl transferase component Bud32/tetratricopeptide (TPR) repeat protein